MHIYVWEKRASGESGSYTITHSAFNSCAYMECIRGGVTSGAASDFAATTNTNLDGSNTDYIATGGTTTIDGSFVTFCVFTWDSNSPMTPPGGTTPTFTERYDPSPSVLYVANGVMTTAGATGDKTSTGTAQFSTGGYVGVLASVKAQGSEPVLMGQVCC
jgi:hypothetical protein